MAIVVLATNILNSIFTKSVINFSLDFGGSWWILPSFCFPCSGRGSNADGPTQDER